MFPSEGKQSLCRGTEPLQSDIRSTWARRLVSSGSFTSTRPVSDVLRPTGMFVSFHKTDSLASSLFISNCKQARAAVESRCTASVVAANSSYSPPLSHRSLPSTHQRESRKSPRLLSFPSLEFKKTFSWRFSFM